MVQGNFSEGFSAHGQGKPLLLRSSHQALGSREAPPQQISIVHVTPPIPRVIPPCAVTSVSQVPQVQGQKGPPGANWPKANIYLDRPNREIKTKGPLHEGEPKTVSGSVGPGAKCLIHWTPGHFRIHWAEGQLPFRWAQGHVQVRWAEGQSLFCQVQGRFQIRWGKGQV